SQCEGAGIIAGGGFGLRRATSIGCLLDAARAFSGTVCRIVRCKRIRGQGATRGAALQRCHNASQGRSLVTNAYTAAQWSPATRCARSDSGDAALLIITLGERVVRQARLRSGRGDAP